MVFCDFYPNTTRYLGDMILNAVVVPSVGASVHASHIVNMIETKEEARDMTQFYAKNPYNHRKIQKITWQHKHATKTSITQRLRTDLGHSVRVTTATQLVWLNRLTGTQPSH